MLNYNFSTRAFLKDTGSLMMRVRWNSKKYEITFSLGYKIESNKWDVSKQLVKANTTFRDGKKIIYAKEINAVIRNTISFVGEAFDEFNKKYG